MYIYYICTQTYIIINIHHFTYSSTPLLLAATCQWPLLSAFQMPSNLTKNKLQFKKHLNLKWTCMHTINNQYKLWILKTTTLQNRNISQFSGLTKWHIMLKIQQWHLKYFFLHLWPTAETGKDSEGIIVIENQHSVACLFVCTIW